MTELAIIVATRDRSIALRRLLASAVAMAGWERLKPEIIVVDDGPSDGTRLVVAEVARHASGVRYLPVPSGGKTRALNRGIRATDASLLAFVDDDVELDAGWLLAVSDYASRLRFDAAQGAIRLPPDSAGNPAVIAAIDRWRTIPGCDLGPGVTEVESLIGANMLIWRSTFARVGLFDERLGPGAAGFGDDSELADRIRGVGGRIGYVPDAVVYHYVDPTRLSAEYFRAFHTRRGLSRIYYKRTGSWRVLPNLGLAAMRLALATIAALPNLRLRALGHWYHYRAMLAATRVTPLAGGVPRLEEARTLPKNVRFAAQEQLAAKPEEALKQTQ